MSSSSLKLWPRKSSTECATQASRIAANGASPTERRSTLPISAPTPPAVGVTVIAAASLGAVVADISLSFAPASEPGDLDVRARPCPAGEGEAGLLLLAAQGAV